jgi:hypothetical protein
MAAPSLRKQPTAPLEIDASYQLREQDLELLSKFQARTVLTITTDKNLRIYQNEIIKLAYSVRTLSSRLATHTDLDGSASILNACGTNVNTNA